VPRTTGRVLRVRRPVCGRGAPGTDVQAGGGILRTSHIERLPCPDTLGPHASCPAPTHTSVAHPRPSLLNPGRSSLEPSLASATLLARTASRRVFAPGRAARTLHQPLLYGPGRRQASIAPGPALTMRGVDGVIAPVRRQRKTCLTHQPRRWTGSVQSATLQMCVTDFLSSLSKALTIGWCAVACRDMGIVATGWFPAGRNPYPARPCRPRTGAAHW